MKIELNLGNEEIKKLEILQSRMGIPSKELAVRKVIEGFSISPTTR